MADELAKFLSTVKSDELVFEAKPHYSKAGDCIIFYLEEGESYAERVDALLTVYRAIKDDRLLGCKIKGIAALLKKSGSLNLQIQDPGITLSILLLISNLVAGNEDYEKPRRRKVYEDLMSAAGGRFLQTKELTDPILS
jgi:hypothetical protein